MAKSGHSPVMWDDAVSDGSSERCWAILRHSPNILRRSPIMWDDVFKGSLVTSRAISGHSLIIWDAVFEGSLVSCSRCRNTIRNFVLRTNPPQPSIEEEISNWSIKIAVEAKEMANDPTWWCSHPPDETVIVDAIVRGANLAIENDEIEKKAREKARVDKVRNAMKAW